MDLLVLRLQCLLITINTALLLIYTIYSSLLHTHKDSEFPLVVSQHRISAQKLVLPITMKSSCHFLFNRPGTSELKLKLFSAASRLVLYSHGTDNSENSSNAANRVLLQTTQKIHVTVIAKHCWVWHHCACLEVCLLSHCLETGCITLLFYCCMLDRVCVAGIA
jgi:hypothetical protein